MSLVRDAPRTNDIPAVGGDYFGFSKIVVRMAEKIERLEMALPNPRVLCRRRRRSRLFHLGADSVKNG